MNPSTSSVYVNDKKKLKYYNSFYTHTPQKTTYQRCIRFFLLLLLFAILKLFCDFGFGFSYEFSERSAVSYTGDKRMLHIWTKDTNIR